MGDDYDLLCYDSGVQKRYELIPHGTANEVIEERVEQYETVKRSIVITIAASGGLSIVFHSVDVVGVLALYLTLLFISILTSLLYFYPSADQIKPFLMSTSSTDGEYETNYRIAYEELHSPPKRIVFEIVGECIYSNINSTPPISFFT